uniref:DNA oxidative demethylase ALKBH2 isoform X3 n=1 Tax=Doryrhamphus excisus TaxID=161450 RepID=UPI0025AE0052|nr:DNA oxidative demethylase ALKBH2 isoform X3 [Doryrhamphus excisus]
MVDAEEDEFSDPVPWQKIESEGLDCDYALLFTKEEADHLFVKLEEEVVYSIGEEAKVQVFGKVYNIPRKQATYGDTGLTYTYSGVTRLACPWTPTLEYIRNAVTKTTGHTFNFVLVNSSVNNNTYDARSPWDGCVFQQKTCTPVLRSCTS